MADNMSIDSSGDSIISEDDLGELESTEMLPEPVEGETLEDELDEEVDFDDEDTELDTSSAKTNNNNSSIIYSIEDTYNNYYTKDKITKPFLTKFERAKILGVRSEMLAGGAVPLIKLDKKIDSVYDIAKMELAQKKIPLLVRRSLPNGQFEDWRLDELSY